EMNLSSFIGGYIRRNADLQLAYQEQGGDIHNKGVMVLDTSQKIVEFVEKPNVPPSRIASAPVFIFQKGIASLVNQYLAQSKQHDLFGHFIEWVIHQRPMYAKITNHRVYDLGTVESYLRCKDLCGENFFSKAE
ncbi:MAG TPA: sugar phosphate nucleotidyltransferase, partial [Candidatus Nanoarchaeia archaeon]|nr:sugar phosphate nucleotidyltransferase [Candidatus Nanoarchaeia archaeon]